MHLSFKRLLIYFLGIVLLAAGLTMNTQVTLGVSSIMSVAYAVSQIFSINYSDVVMAWYSLFVVIQLILHCFVLHEKNKIVYLFDVLQILFSLVFTRIMNLFFIIIPVFETECEGFFATIWFRLIMLAVAIILTGAGAALTLAMKLIPNPGDGIVAVLAQVIKKPVGTTKNIVDAICVAAACLISFLLTGKIIGVGIGTLASVLGVGRVINYINKRFHPAQYAE